MPYDRDRVASELLSLYEFLVSMWLPEDIIRRPPSEGWAKITAEEFDFLDKTDAVFDLLRHIPYLRQDIEPQIPMYPYSRCNDYLGAYSFERWSLEPPEEVQPHLATLFAGVEASGYFVYLNTRDGTVERRDNEYGSGGPGSDGYFDSIAEFCESVKSDFRQLCAVPMGRRSSYEPVEVEFIRGDEEHPVKQIYRKHGWPSSSYNKAACRAEVEEYVRLQSQKGRE